MPEDDNPPAGTDYMPDMGYPHQQGDVVTHEHLAAHVAANPEMYHVGLLPHIERLLGDMATDEGADVELVAEAAPPADSGQSDASDTRHQDDLRKLMTLHAATLESDQKDKAPQWVRSGFAINELLDKPPAEVRRHIKHLRQLERSTGHRTMLLEDYDEYVAAVREVRREQRQHIDEQLREVPDIKDPLERRKKFLEAVSYSPVVGQRVLMGLTNRGNDMFDSGAKLVPIARAAELAANKELFTQAFEQLTLANPSLVIGHRREVSSVVDNETIRSALIKLPKVASSALRNLTQEQFDGVVSQLQDQSDRETFLGAVSSMPYGGLKFILANQAYIDSVGTETIRQMFADDEKKDYFDARSELLPAYDKGLIDEQQLRVMVDAWAEQKRFSIAGSIYQHPTISPTLKQHIHATAANMLQAGSSDMLASTILSVAEKTEWIRQHTQAEPLTVLGIYNFSVNEVEDVINVSALKDALQPYFDDPMLLGDHEVRLLIDTGLYDKQEKKTFIDRLYEQRPDAFLTDFYSIKLSGVYSETALTDKLEQVLLHMSSEAVQYYVGFVDYCTNPEVKRQFIDKVLSSPTASLIGIPTKTLQELYDNNQLRNLFDAELERFDSVSFGTSYAVEQILGMYEQLLGKEEAGRYFSQITTRFPEKRLDYLKINTDLIQLEDARAWINEFAATSKGRKQLIEKMDSYQAMDWTAYVLPEFVSHLIMHANAAELEEVISNERAVTRFVGDDKFKALKAKFSKLNPAYELYTLEFSGEAFGEKHQQVIERALSDETRMSILGTYLSEELGRFRSLDNPRQRQLILQELFYKYLGLAMVEEQGYLPQLQRLHDAGALNAKAESQLLDSVQLMVRLGEGDRLAEAQSPADLKRLTTGAVAHALDMESSSLIQPELEERMRVFGIYVGQYADSKEHKAVLRSIYPHLIDDSYNDWKFGQDSQQALEDLQTNRLLPKGLTLEQYKLWRSDEATDVHEVFSVEAESLAADIKLSLNENERYLRGTLSPEFNPAENSQLMAEAGQRIAELHRQLKVLRGEPDQTLTVEQLAETEAELADVTDELRLLQFTEDVQTLYSLTPEEIRSGRTAAADGKGKGREIRQLVSRFYKNLGREHAFVGDQLDALFDNFYHQSGEARSMSVTDSSDALETLKVGAEPLGTCQHYLNGIMNEALLGYTDPNSKILLLKNERGKPMGRAIFRMVSQEDGSPALHLDTYYGVENSDGARRALYAHAIKKAQKLGMPLYRSEKSQNEDGEDIESRPVPGIRFEESDIKLSSSASRAPYVYVDAANGMMRKGKYVITNVAAVSLQD